MTPYILNFIALIAITLLVMVSFSLLRAVIGRCTVNPFDFINITVGMSTAYLLYFYELV